MQNTSQEQQGKLILWGTLPINNKVLNASHTALLKTEHKEVSSKPKQLATSHSHFNSQIIIFFFQVTKH